VFLWIDPPGPDAGWVHELKDWDDIPSVLEGYPNIPEDNNERKLAYDEAHAGEDVEQFQAGRDYWGVTAMYQLPTPMPSGVIMVGPDGKEIPDE